MPKIKPKFILFFFLPFSCFSQTVHQYTHVWNEVNFVGKINKKLAWQLDAEYFWQSEESSLDAVQFANHLMFRPWIHFYASNKVRLSLGNCFYINYPIPNIQRDSHEYRIVLQASINSPHPSSSITNKFRFEVRNIEDVNKIYHSSIATRYNFRFVKPLNHVKLEQGTHYFAVADEIFGNWGGTMTGHRFLNQNRFYLGYGYVFSKKFTLEVDYINQSSLDDSGNNLTMNHVIGLFYRFDVPNVFN